MTRFCYDLMQDRLLAKLQIHNPSNGGICFHISSSAPFPCPITQKTISPIHEPPLEFPFQNSRLLQTSQESQAWDEPKAERSWGLCPVRGWIHFCPLILPPTELLGLSLGVGTGLVLPSAPERWRIRHLSNLVHTNLSQLCLPTAQNHCGDTQLFLVATSPTSQGVK